MIQKMKKVSLWAYLASLAVFAFGDIFGVAAKTMDMGAAVFISHLVVLVIAPGVLVTLYSTYLSPRAPVLLNIAVAIIHVILSPLPATMFSPAFSNAPLAGFFGVITGLAMCLFGFLAIMDTDRVQSGVSQSGSAQSNLVNDWRLPYGSGPLFSEMDFHVRQIGNAGQGLNASGFSQENIDLGIRGEKATAIILDHVRARYRGLLVGHSLRVNPTTDSDLDHLFVIGRSIIIIDSKMWKANCNYTLRYNPMEFNLEVLVRDFATSQESIRSTAMPWMIDQVRAQFPGYRVKGLICVHGVSEEAGQSQAVVNDLDGGDNSLRIIKAQDLHAELEREAREAVVNAELTDSAMIERMSAMSK